MVHDQFAYNKFTDLSFAATLRLASEWWHLLNEKQQLQDMSRQLRTTWAIVKKKLARNPFHLPIASECKR